jgi:ferritin-like metal-binding protein YciE
VEVEHHEIGVYENLISGARAMAREDVAQILGRNLASEQAALDKARHAHDRVAAVTPKNPAQSGNGEMMDRIKDAVS